MCKYYFQNKCKFTAEECVYTAVVYSSYAHGQEDLAVPEQDSEKKRYKTDICNHFRTNNCKFPKEKCR